METVDVFKWIVAREGSVARCASAILLLVAVSPLLGLCDDDDDDDRRGEIQVAMDVDVAYSARASAREMFPRFEGELEIGIENDATYRAQDSEEEVNSLFVSAEAEFELLVNENFSIEAELTLEPLEDADDGRLEERLRAREESPDNREFDDHTLFLEQFTARWEGEEFEAYVGKFNPKFGRAYEFAVGPFGDEDNFSEDYAIEERLGGGVSFELSDPAYGEHEVSVEAFTLDTTNLTRGLLRSRGRNKRSDGGPSNTGSPNSFAFGVEGGEIPGLSGLTYNLGLVYQKGGRRGPFPSGSVGSLVSDDDDDDDDDEDDDPMGLGLLDDDLDMDADDDDDDDDEGSFMRDRGSLERDFVAGLGYSLTYFEKVPVDLLTEYVYIDNADGEKNRLRRFLTLAAAAEWRSLRFGLAYTLRSEGVPLDSDQRAYLGLASIGHFRPLGPDGRLGRIGFEAGFRMKRDMGQRSNTAALRLSYKGSF